MRAVLGVVRDRRHAVDVPHRVRVDPCTELRAARAVRVRDDRHTAAAPQLLGVRPGGACGATRTRTGSRAPGRLPQRCVTACRTRGTAQLDRREGDTNTSQA